jgi:triphosphoribosyl-dephospho-CoA synthetase
MTTPKQTAKPTVFDDKVRQLLKNEMSTGTDLSANAWDLDRSTPMGTLKGLIRKVNTPDRALNLTLVHALVLRTDDNIKSFYETVKNEEAGVEYQMIRVMVLSDTRHFC